jgi:hypothetical protein
VILIVSRPETGEAYWVSVKDYFSTPEKKKGLRIDFDKMKDVFGPATLHALQNLARGSGLYLGPAPIEERLLSNLLPVSAITKRFTRPKLSIERGKRYARC